MSAAVCLLLDTTTVLDVLDRELICVYYLVAAVVVPPGMLFIFRYLGGLPGAVSGRLKSVIAHAHKTPSVSHIP